MKLTYFTHTNKKRKIKLRKFFTCRFVLIGLLSVMINLGIAGQNTYFVDTTSDFEDTNPGDGSCADNAGKCSLRAAIQESNADGVASNIYFSINGTNTHTIHPSSPLPYITDDNTVIDATTQFEWSLGNIILDGTQSSDNGIVIEIGTHNTEIYGFVIQNFLNHGIAYLNTPPVSGGSSNNFTLGGIGKGNIIFNNANLNVFIKRVNGGVIQGNYIGVDNNNIQTTISNGGVLCSGCDNFTIGGSSSGEGNIISGNANYGLNLAASDTNSSDNNTVIGNIIGTDVNGITNYGNEVGLKIAGTNNVIGGNTSSDRNIIAYNSIAAIQLFSYPPFNFIAPSNGNLLINELHCNGEGIDLNGQNSNKMPPILTAVTSSSIHGVAAPNDVIHVFQHIDNGCSNVEIQGKVYLGTITADANSGSWTLSDGISLNNGDQVTATATDANNNTSEFSECGEVGLFCPCLGTSNTIYVTNANDAGIGSLRQAIICANTDPVLDNIYFDIQGTAPHTILIDSEGGNLPNITDDEITIDGQYNNNLGDIILDGINQSNGSGLVINPQVQDVKILGLTITNFPHHGISVQGENTIIGTPNKENILIDNGRLGFSNSYNISIQGDNVIVQSNYVGFNPINASSQTSETGGIYIFASDGLRNEK